MQRESGKSGPAKMSDRLRENNLVQAWLVLVLAIAFGTALSAVQAKLGPTIEQNRLDETLRQVPELVWGEQAAGIMSGEAASVTITPEVMDVKSGDKTVYYKLFRVVRDGRIAGWVVKTGGQGYADRIDLLVGVDPGASALTGLFVLDQKETPGLGNKIESADWRGQFAGRKTDQPLTVVKDGGDAPYTVDAITGATISSRSVTGIVNRALRDLKPRLAAASGAR